MLELSRRLKADAQHANRQSLLDKIVHRIVEVRMPPMGKSDRTAI
jgi:hypothetical protein